MNSKQCDRLQDAAALLNKALKIVNSILDEERDALESMTEDTELYDQTEELVSTLEYVVDDINSAMEGIDEDCLFYKRQSFHEI